MLGLLAHQGAAQGQARSYDELIADAVAEFGQGHWEESRSLFREAHAARPSARTLRGLGMVEFELRDYVECVRFLSAALDDSRSPLTPALREKTERLLRRAESFVGSFTLQLRPPTATLRVDGRRPQLGADGALLLDAGEHRLVAQATEHEDLIRSIDVAGGEDEPLVLELKPLAAGAPATTDHAGGEDDDGDLLSSPWLWIAAGIAIVVGGAATVALASGGDESSELHTGNTGIVLQGP